MVTHSGPPPTKELWETQEAEADRWASCALIPEAKIRMYNNPTLSGFMACIRKYYVQERSDWDHLKMLAARISHARLRALRDDVA